MPIDIPQVRQMKYDDYRNSFVYISKIWKYNKTLSLDVT